MNYQYQGNTYETIEAVYQAANTDARITEIIDMAQWYIERYSHRKEQLLNMVDIYTALEYDIDIQTAYDNIEETCQRICNPCDFEPDAPTEDCGADYL